MFRKLYVFIGIFAIACSINAQINLVSDSIYFRTSSDAAKLTHHYGSLSVLGSNTAAGAALSATWQGTSSGNYVGVSGVCQPTGNSGTGGFFAGSVMGVNASSGFTGNTSSNFGGHFTAAANSNSSAVTAGVYATCSGSGSSQQWAAYFAGSTWCTGTYQSSDSAIKTNIVALDSSLSKIMNLQPKKYEFNTQKYPKLGLETGTKIGLIAQDVEKVVPEAVKDVALPEENQANGLTSIKSINYTALIPVLIGAIQEQQKEIDQLKQTVTALQK